VRTLHAELLKVRTAPRTMIGLVLGMLALVGLGAAGTASGHAPGDRLLRDLMDIASFSLVFALITGVLIVTWEFRHGTIEQTFIVSPRRERVMTAKALAAAVVGGVLGVLGVAVAVVVAYAWIGLGEPGVDFGSGELWGRAVRVAIAAILWGALGVGVGALVRNQAGAIVLVFVWLFVLEPIVPLISDTAAKYTLGTLRMAFLEVGDEHGVAVGTAGVLLAVYVVVVAGAGTLVTLRRDIT
jgi:ABC-2 type transport system permease protein